MAGETNYWEQVRRGRMNRRGILQGGAALGGAGLAAAFAGACSSSSNKSAAPTGGGALTGGGAATTAAGAAATTTAAKQPKRGGTLNHLSGSQGADAFAAGLDPHTANESFTAPMSWFYQGLMVQRTSNPQQLDPAIAQKWEQPDQGTYVFHLQPGVKWHNKPPANGRALTVDDVVFSIKRAGTNDPRFFTRSLVENVDQVTATDNATVKITTKKPEVTTLLKLANSSLAILNPEVVDKAGKFAGAETAVGTGAFIVQSYQPQVSAQLVRNPDYYKPGLPYLDGIRLLVQMDTQAGYAAFVAGQLDQIIVPGQFADEIIAQSNKYNSSWWNDIAPQYLWQNTKKKPFDDPRVNVALKLFMDHKEFISAWANTYFGPKSGYNTSVLGYGLRDWDFTDQEFANLLEWKQPKDDAVKQALSLLSAAGYTKENPLKFEHSGVSGGFSQAAVELYEGQIKRLAQGVVQPTVRVLDNPTLISQQVNGTVDVTGPVARVSTFDPDESFTEIFHTGGSQNYGKWSDPTVDAMIDKESSIFDTNQRKAAVKEILKYLVDHAPYTAPCSRNLLSAVPLKVQNFSAEPIYAWGQQYDQIWLNG